MLNHISKPQIQHKPPHALYAAVCALHEQELTLVCKLWKKFKYANLFSESYQTSVTNPKGVNPLSAS